MMVLKMCKTSPGTKAKSAKYIGPCIGVVTNVYEYNSDSRKIFSEHDFLNTLARAKMQGEPVPFTPDPFQKNTERAQAFGSNGWKSLRSVGSVIPYG